MYNYMFANVEPNLVVPEPLYNFTLHIAIIGAFQSNSPGTLAHTVPPNCIRPIIFHVVATKERDEESLLRKDGHNRPHMLAFGLLKNSSLVSTLLLVDSQQTNTIANSLKIIPPGCLPLTLSSFDFFMVIKASLFPKFHKLE